MSKKVIVVFGATGGQGASVARAFAQHPQQYMVRGLTRDVNTQHAQKLRQDGADLIPYDPTDSKSIESALTGAYAAFVNTVTDYSDPNCFENEKAQGRLIADACKAANVGHVIFSSQLHTARVTGSMVRHMVAKAEIEDYMRHLRLPTTFLLMPLYYEDFCGLFRPMTCDGCHFDLFLPTGMTPVQMMSVEDLGEEVVAMVEDRQGHLGHTYSLCGDKLTMWEVAKVLSAYMAPKTFRDKQLTVHEFSQLDLPGVCDWAQMFNFLVREDQRYKIRPTRRSFEQWVCHNRESLNRVLA